MITLGSPSSTHRHHGQTKTNENQQRVENCRRRLCLLGYRRLWPGRNKNDGKLAHQFSSGFLLGLRIRPDAAARISTPSAPERDVDTLRVEATSTRTPPMFCW